MLLLLLLFCFVFECVEPDVPELLEEVLELGKPFGTCSVQAPRAVASLAHEPRLLQDVQVLGDRRPRHVEVGCDLAGAQLVVADECEDLPPPRGGDGFECGLHDRYVSTSLRKKQLNFTIGSDWRTFWVSCRSLTTWDGGARHTRGPPGARPTSCSVARSGQRLSAALTSSRSRYRHTC